MSHADPDGHSDRLLYESRGLDSHAPGDPVLILLHGRGSNERDLLGLHPFLQNAEGLEADPALLTPRAPFPGRDWGYGAGWAWYRYLDEDRVVPDTLMQSLTALDNLIARLPAILGHEPGPIFLGGFSQGGTTSLAWALTRPGRVAGVINLSGFLARVPDVDRAVESIQGGSDDGAPPLRVFWGHGQADPAIPFALGERGRERLQAVGVDLETLDHPSGHTITPGELRELTRWIAKRLEWP